MNTAALEALVGPVSALERLGGGLLNEVWRVHRPCRPSVIAKHAPPYVASAPEIALSPERIHIEARALQLFARGAPLASLCGEALRPVELLGFDPDQDLLVLEDLGTALVPLTELEDDAERHAERLGQFLGRLHSASLDEAHRRGVLNPDVQRTRLAVQYDAVPGWLEDAGRDPARGQAARQLGRAFLEPGRCLIMGDLWPPSLVVTPAHAVRLIDWEFAHIGQPAQDLGHLAAHLWLQRERLHFAPLTLLEAWRRTVDPALDDETTARQSALHAACEILARTLGPFAQAERDPQALDRATALLDNPAQGAFHW